MSVETLTQLNTDDLQTIMAHSQDRSARRKAMRALSQQNPTESEEPAGPSPQTR